MRLQTRLASAAALLVGIVAVSAVAQPPRGQFGGGGFGGGGAIALLNSKMVKTELNVTEEQESQLKDWAKEYAPKMGEMMKDKLSGIPREEMREKMAEIMAEISKNTYTEIATVLKPEQVKRLKQIEIQSQGLRAFTNAEVVSALKLSDDQKDQIKDATDTMGRDMRELRDEYGIKGFNPRPTDAAKAKEYDSKVTSLTKETFDKVKGLLSDSQKTAWTGLIGKEIDVAQLQSEMRPAIGAGGRPGFQGKKKKIDD